MLLASVQRGVLREFEERTGSGGRFEARFRWLLPRPLRVVVDVTRRRLSCPNLLDGIPPKSALRRELTTFLAGRHAAELPEHRRVDSARCRIICAVRAERLTLALEVRNGDWEYAAHKLINLVHEAYVYLQRNWADYAYQSLGAALE